MQLYILLNEYRKGFYVNQFIFLYSTGNNPRIWSKDDGGWEMHLLSTITEWLCAIAICIFILSFTNEFREIELHYPKVI